MCGPVAVPTARTAAAFSDDLTIAFGVTAKLEGKIRTRNGKTDLSAH